MQFAQVSNRRASFGVGVLGNTRGWPRWVCLKEYNRGIQLSEKKVLDWFSQKVSPKVFIAGQMHDILSKMTKAKRITDNRCQLQPGDTMSIPAVLIYALPDQSDVIVLQFQLSLEQSKI